MSGGGGAGAGFQGLRQLAARLRNASFRTAFANDPQAALAQAGIAAGAIPGDILNVLQGLSAEELATLARVRGILEAGNVPDDIKAEMV
jgi:hypothetical protein